MLGELSVTHTFVNSLGAVLFISLAMIGQAALGKQRGLLEGLPRAEAKLELSFWSPSTDRLAGRDCGGPGWLQTLAVAAKKDTLAAALSQCSHTWCLVAQRCQGMICYEFETWCNRGYRPALPNALIFTSRH